MKLTISRNELYNAVRVASRVCPDTGKYAGMLVIAGADGLFVQACDGEMMVRRQAQADVTEPGTEPVSGKTLFDLVSSLNDGDLAISSSHGSIGIKSGWMNNSIRTMGLPDEYAQMPGGVQPVCRIPSAQLLTMVERTVFAAARADDNRSILTGVYMRFDENVTLAASDGFRLAVCSVPSPDLPVDGNKVTEFIVPARAVNELAYLIGAESPGQIVDIAMSANRNQVVFNLGRGRLAAQLIEGRYSDYKRVMVEGDSTMRAVAGAGDLERLCKVVNVMARESAHIAKFAFAAGELTNTLEMFAPAFELGDGHGTIDLLGLAGTPMEIVFNVKHVLEAVRVAGGKIVFKVNAPTQPAAIQAEGDDSWMYVQMPIDAHNINWKDNR